MPSRNQIEFGALVFMTGWVATGMGLLLYSKTTTGPDGKPRPSFKLDDTAFTFGTENDISVDAPRSDGNKKK
jgi:hypothetical protein